LITGFREDKSRLLNWGILENAHDVSAQYLETKGQKAGGEMVKISVNTTREKKDRFTMCRSHRNQRREAEGRTNRRKKTKEGNGFSVDLIGPKTQGNELEGGKKKSTPNVCSDDERVSSEFVPNTKKLPEKGGKKGKVGTNTGARSRAQLANQGSGREKRKISSENGENRLNP